MPIYMMSGEGDSNNLDFVTRERMRDSVDDDNLFWIKLFMLVCVFVLGMIFGSALHDSMFHAIEVVH